MHLARSAKEAGVRQFIFLSTVLVHGRSNDGRAPFSESDVLTPRGLYGVSKAAAETGLNALAQYRRHAHYGGSAAARLRFRRKGEFRAARQGRETRPSTSARRHRQSSGVPVGRESLTSFISRRLSISARNFDIFLVADQEQVSTPEFIARLAKAAGVRSRLFPMPISVLSALLKVSGKPDAYDSLIGSLELDVSKVASIGWKPPVSLDEGLHRRSARSDT